jgi:hypothetical protein
MKMFLLSILMLMGLGLAMPVHAATTGATNPDCTKSASSTAVDANGNPLPACVDDNVDTSGALSKQLSQDLYCQSKKLLSGNIGLLIGVVIALFGLYQMAGGNLMGGLVLLVCGALVTALPSLVESFLTGVGSVLSTGGTSLGATTFKPPSC